MTAKEFILRMLTGTDNFSLAKHGADLGKKMMDRECVCGHQCRDHNFVPHQGLITQGYPCAKIPDSCKSCECTKFANKSKDPIYVTENVNRVTELHDKYCQCQECQK